ncbi:MAG: tetratricopeptide repeat protein [Treponema sp.]|nr:tetratricopeptide repeat protein [Treponema sp.]
MKKVFKASAALVLSLVAFTCVSCGNSYNSIKRMQKMEEGVSSPTTKEELQEAIEKYDRRAIDLVTTQAQEGIWYKILGTRYLDEQLYGKAYEAFQKALEFYPNNANLYYYLAVCAGYISNSTIDWNVHDDGSVAATKMKYLRVSEESFMRALSIDPKYYRAMYGLGVLYVFDMGEPEKAVPYLEEYLRTQTKDTDGMFVLARAYYENLEFEKSIALYDKIIELKPNAEKVSQAEANKRTVTEMQYKN